MLIKEKLYVWGDRAKHVPQGPRVYAFYNEDKALIYIGASSNFREEFTHCLKTNFSHDLRKREIKYYMREFTSKQLL